MKKGNLYIVGFIIALSCLCVAVLTFANIRRAGRIAANKNLDKTQAIVETSEPCTDSPDRKEIIDTCARIADANENFDKVRAIVNALGLCTGSTDRKEIIDTYVRTITVTKPNEITVYEARRDDKLTGYALEIVGPGRNGLINGILAIGPDRKKILGLRIYQQKETPSLGGQIASPQWLSQFPNIPLVTNGMPGVTVSSTEKGPNIIAGITGATKTVCSLVKILNKAITEFQPDGITIAMEELDLGLNVDTVTQATPGYPKNLIKPLHLRKKAKRPPFMIPSGAKNLALGKSVTSTMEDEPIIGELSQITDDIKKSGDFDYVELDLGPQWVQIDLGKIHNIYAVVVWHFYKNPTIYNDVIVQLADDANFTGNVKTIFNNDHDDSTGLGKGGDTAYFARWWGEIADARGPENKGTPAQYVRVYTNGGTAQEDTRFVEVAVYGK